MMRIIIGLSLLAMSAVSYAGGGGGSKPEWYPKVYPINCAVNVGDEWVWRNIEECNEVIRNGYAKGVRYNGKFLYKDYTTSSYDGVISPGKPYNPHKLNKPLLKVVTYRDAATWVK